MSRRWGESIKPWIKHPLKRRRRTSSFNPVSVTPTSLRWNTDKTSQNHRVKTAADSLVRFPHVLLFNIIQSSKTKGGVRCNVIQPKPQGRISYYKQEWINSGCLNALYLIWHEDQLNPCPIYVMNHIWDYSSKATNKQLHLIVAGKNNTQIQIWDIRS